MHYKLNEFPYVVNHIVFSPTGDFFAASSAGDGDGTLLIWDTETGEKICSFEGHTNFISSLSCSPDGNQLISSSWDQTTRIWDIATGKELRQLQPVINVSTIYSPDMGRIACVQSHSKRIVIYDSKTLDTLMILDGHLSEVNSLFYGSDGKTIVSYDNNATTKLWDSETGDCMLSVKGYFIAFSPNDKYCLLRKEKDLNSFDIYNVEEGVCVHSIASQTDTICGAAFSDDGSYVMTVHSDGTIRKWDFPPLQDLIDQTRERFKDRPLTAEERKMYYLE